MIYQFYILGWVTKAKNQYGCGSCAAFAAVGAVESSLLKAGAEPSTLDISEQWLLDCSGQGSCAGASINAYQNWMVRDGNLVHEKDNPYKGRKKDQCPSVPYWSPGYKITMALTLWSTTDERIMTHIMEFGATVVGLYAKDPGFVHYKSGVFDECR